MEDKEFRVSLNIVVRTSQWQKDHEHTFKKVCHERMRELCKDFDEFSHYVTVEPFEEED